MEDLIHMAETQGLYVAWRPLRRLAYYQHSASLIVLNTRAPQWKIRCALAHELGHAHWGHDWTRDHDAVTDERQADQYAARLLISREHYASAEDMVGSHPGAIARELGVTRRFVELRQQDFARDHHIFTTVDEWRTA